VENTGKTVEYPFLWGKVVEIPARRSVMRPMDPAKGEFCMNKKQKKNLQRIIIALILVLILKLLPQFPTPVELVLYCIPYLVVGWDVLRKALLGIKNRQPFDECFLMAVATVGAFALGDYVEGCAVIIFYQIGELFQSVAVGKSRQSISSLMDIRPDYANIEGEDGRLEQVDPDDVEIGTVIVVQPGERVPIDGVIVEGASALNTAALTGESLPRDVQTGDEVISGCVNMTGLLKVKTTKEFGESTVSKILDLVENSSMKKARAENFITRFARVYTPAVCYGALALAFIPPIVLLLMGQPARFGDWVYRALTFLVISCPCALVISIPLSFFGGIGGASACGILVKGSTYLEELARTGIVVFDKTGTLTQGTFKVTGIHPAEGISEEQLVEAAALAESWSKHPISLSIKAAYGREIDPNRVTDVQELGGHGVTAKVDGRTVAAGNARLMEKLGLKAPAVSETGTIVHVAIEGMYAGYLLIADVVKPHSAQAIRGLKDAGVRKTVMLTGDAEPVAKAVSAELGLDEYHAGLLPGDKVDQIETLLAAKRPKENLAFVGDGINDAPVLSRADVGIAMGALGSDAAIEAADVVLMDDDPAKIALAMRIARRTLRIVYQNIVFALAIKFACLVLGAIGMASMWTAIFADVGVMVLAVLNATRALYTKDLAKKNEQ
jgi:Cd2+/Zn2+-exporting ATPase